MEQKQLGPSDVCALMREDHEDIRDHLRLCQSAQDSASAREAREAFEAELTLHLHVEQQVVYGFVKHQEAETEPLVAQACSDHTEIEHALTAFMRAAPGDAAFFQRLRQLSGILDSHFEAEERQIFPVLGERLAPRDSSMLVDAVAERKNELLMLRAVTPPHPEWTARRLPGARHAWRGQEDLDQR